jgi:hypothetical protein
MVPQPTVPLGRCVRHKPSVGYSVNSIFIVGTGGARRESHHHTPGSAYPYGHKKVIGRSLSESLIERVRSYNDARYHGVGASIVVSNALAPPVSVSLSVIGRTASFGLSPIVSVKQS